MPYGDSQGSGRAIALLGDHWNLRILFSAHRGVERFNELQRDLGISASVLTQRLQALVEEGVLAHAIGPDGRPTRRYVLTDAGKDIWSTLLGLWLWDQRWAKDAPSVGEYRLRHATCGHSSRPVSACASCTSIALTARDTQVDWRGRPHTFDDPDADGERPRYRRSSKAPVIGADGRKVMRSVDLLGDRWSALVLSAAFLGCHRFSEFEAMLSPIPPPTLSTRLADFVESGVLERAELRDHPGYRLTVKGHDFFPVLASMMDWGETWTPSGSAIVTVHRHCGSLLRVAWLCNVCREPVTRENTRFEPAEMPVARPQEDP